MESISTFSTGTKQVNAGVGRAIHVEQQLTRIIPQVLLSVSSSELSRTLRRALAISEHHQRRLAKNYEASAGSFTDSIADELEKQICAVAGNHQRGCVNDLTYTFLITKVIQYKMSCYEQALEISEQKNLADPQRVLGAALSDEAATALFLEELAERLFLRQFPGHASMA
ncbi:Ferritin-like metal-binding protein YciE [Dyadobacter soli]|uniref:Ferritin-like metal-binding protein YciE n=1 Tax=Dyadobacter soli TaxID=659014 RepID=A0A1G7VFQ0_9BACT|nr:DUF892 family protein [Dyadobacter soli]SDG58645.1 Ferritin-like metal-binding protein YciE [Dyadobacter soli]